MHQTPLYHFYFFLSSIRESFFSFYWDDNLIIFSLRANSDVDPPDPISNSEVKHVCADDTWREAAWESRTVRGVYFTKQLKIEE